MVYSAKYHLIWCPKFRRRVLVGRLDERLKELVRDVYEKRKARGLGLEVMADHAHPLVQVHPTTSPAQMVGALKGRSSRELRREFLHLRKLPALWTGSCFCSTVGGDPLEVVRRYVENQRVA